MDAKEYLGKEVEMIIDRPLGSKHSKNGFIYKANYGYVPGTRSPDGEELDAYYLGINKPIKKTRGICIAIIHRTNDNDDKLVVIPKGKLITDEDVFPDLWEFPSGKREPFETSHNALVREIKEEVGIDVEIIMPVDIFEFKIEKEDEIRDVTQISFLCKPIGGPKVKLSDEHQNFAWIDEKELDKYELSKETKEVIRKALEIYKKI